MSAQYQLLGPFRELLPMTGLPECGAISDDQLLIIKEGGILIANQKVIAVGKWEELKNRHPQAKGTPETEDLIAFPGMIDAHTHICFAGSRAMDFAARNGGVSYLEIAKAGGGIWSTVTHTRAATQADLVSRTMMRLDRLLSQGVTTVEVKSGYGLSMNEELKLLRAIQQARKEHQVDVVTTCLAAHMRPKDYEGTAEEYLNEIITHLVPVVQEEQLTNRFDVFIEESAFTPAKAMPFLLKLKEQGFDITVHGDQFTVGGSQVAIECGALSVDHLEASGIAEVEALAKSSVIPVALPGATIGLGCSWTPARALLDAGCALAIASDWNPGSAPQGNLLLQASLLATFQSLSSAEVWAGITQRAARALGLKDRGTLAAGMQADVVAFSTDDYREVLYAQGMMSAAKVWKSGQEV